MCSEVAGKLEAEAVVIPQAVREVVFGSATGAFLSNSSYRRTYMLLHYKHLS